MARSSYSASEAAKLLGISTETLRRWDNQGRIQTERDSSNWRRVPASEIERFCGEQGNSTLSAENRFRGTVTNVVVDGLMAQIELVVTAPMLVVAIITRDSAEELDLRAGVPATAIVKATSVMVER